MSPFPSAAAAATREASGSWPKARSTLVRRRSNAASAAASAGRPAVIAVTPATIASYQPRTAPESSSSSPSARTIAATESGPARLRRSSATPVGSIASSRRSASARTKPANRARTASSRNGRANGSRWRACSAPSRESMLDPTTCAVEKRGSSTVKTSESRITSSARSRRVTSQPSSAGSHETGSCSRSRARSGCGSSSSSAIVAAAPSGNVAARSSDIQPSLDCPHGGDGNRAQALSRR